MLNRRSGPSLGHDGADSGDAGVDRSPTAATTASRRTQPAFAQFIEADHGRLKVRYDRCAI
jgi:hypothetical protein